LRGSAPPLDVRYIKMLYSIIKSFSPSEGEAWSSYCEWRGIQFKSFDSIDGILRPSLIDTPSDEDWNYIVNESYKLHLMTDIEYAKKKHKEIGQGCIIGLKFEDHQIKDEGLLGFDIIDGYCDVSLLTNWGNDIEIVNQNLDANALVSNYEVACEIHGYLKENYSDDNHVEDCEIISVYKVN
tara:strand:+ start:181 stop:726 length:546 start_codon:yes stop_codon:yes gene_type:complete